jgi:hypothetical protein
LVSNYQFAKPALFAIPELSITNRPTSRVAKQNTGLVMDHYWFMLICALFTVDITLKISLVIVENEKCGFYKKKEGRLFF